jgi:formylglycine-generating enzyme required for sulfatase activity
MVVLARLAAVAVLVAAGLVRGVEAQQCSTLVSTYCTAGTTVHGCVPWMSAVGSPDVAATNGFDVVVNNAPGQRFGTIFFGFYPTSLPWAPSSPSFQCVAFPIQRTGDRFSGGVAGQCNGEFRFDFNAWRAANPGGLGAPYVAGQMFYAQGWFRDPGAPKQTNLSNGLAFTLGTIPPNPPGMVVIPAGTFQMGSNAPNASPYFNNSNQQPVHQVTFSRCFWMGATEVTQAQYLALMGTNPSYYVGANRPVETVDWFDAQAYCAALTAQQSVLGNVPLGYQYRLPTEAEWEYACRAGTTTEFNVGPVLSCNESLFYYSYHTNTCCQPNCVPFGTAPVRSYAPNAWGLYDMHGNMFEWCLDSFAAYSPGSATDPFVTGGPDRVVRGGSWGHDSYVCRSAFRVDFNPGSTVSAVGFRVVLAPILVP